MFPTFGLTHHKAQDDHIMNLNIIGRGRFLLLMHVSLRVKRILHLKGNIISYTIKKIAIRLFLFYDEYS